MDPTTKTPTTSIDEAVRKLLDVQQRLIDEANRVRHLADLLTKLGQTSEGDTP